MKERNGEQLDQKSQELLWEVVSDKLVERGFSEDEERNFDGIYLKLPSVVKELMIETYLMGFNDGVSRVVYGADSEYGIRNRFAGVIREEIEERFVVHRGETLND